LQGAYRTLDSIGSRLGAGAGPKAPRAEAPAIVRLGDGGDFDQRRAGARGSSVRLATDKLDALMAAVGELLVSRIGAERRVADVRALEAALDRWDSTRSKRCRRTEQTAQDAVAGPRMLAASTLFEPLPRMVRDLARDSGKEVTLSISGGDTEVDRSV